MTDHTNPTHFDHPYSLSFGACVGMALGLIIGSGVGWEAADQANQPAREMAQQRAEVAAQTLKGANMRVGNLEAELALRDRRVAELTAAIEGGTDDVGLIVERDLLMAETRKLEAQLTIAVRERESLRATVRDQSDELHDLAAALEEELAAADFYIERIDELAWSDFLAEVQLEVCDRGLPSAVDRCRADVHNTLAANDDRWSACVNAGTDVPQLVKLDRGNQAPAEATPLGKRRYAVLWCDPTLPEAGEGVAEAG